jgi:hypothetical protein
VKRKTIAVDWDGTLVMYHGWKGAGVYGAPIPKMVARVRKWIAQGHEVIIFTSRASVEHNPADVIENLQTIDVALRGMKLPQLEVTANKYTRITEFWDDRGVRVERNTGKYCEDLGSVQRS